MEELSIEQKAQRYDEAIEQLRAMMPNWENLSYNGKTFLQDLVHIIPELKESEDEKIRKEIIKYLEQTVPHHHHDEVLKSKEWIAWLEETKELKKIEQKSSAWSEEDECYMSECIGAIATKDGWSFEEKRKTKHWLKALKDRYTWKPSDEQMDNK